MTLENEQSGPTAEWQTLLPEGISEEATSWEIEVLGKGKIQVALRPEAGTTYEEDGKVHVLGGDPTIPLKPEVLLERGYGTFELEYSPQDPDELVWIEVRAGNTTYETIMQQVDKSDPRQRSNYWSQVLEGEDMGTGIGRDIMTTRDILEVAQLRFFDANEIGIIEHEGGETQQ